MFSWCIIRVVWWSLFDNSCTFYNYWNKLEKNRNIYEITVPLTYNFHWTFINVVQFLKYFDFFWVIYGYAFEKRIVLGINKKLELYRICVLFYSDNFRHGQYLCFVQLVMYNMYELALSPRKLEFIMWCFIYYYSSNKCSL